MRNVAWLVFDILTLKKPNIFQQLSFLTFFFAFFRYFAPKYSQRPWYLELSGQLFYDNWYLNRIKLELRWDILIESPLKMPIFSNLAISPKNLNVFDPFFWIILSVYIMNLYKFRKLMTKAFQKDIHFI